MSNIHTVTTAAHHHHHQVSILIIGDLSPFLSLPPASLFDGPGTESCMRSYPILALCLFRAVKLETTHEKQAQTYISNILEGLLSTASHSSRSRTSLQTP